MESIGRGVLDTPLEPVIGLAEGETRWRGMTTECEAGVMAPKFAGTKGFLWGFALCSRCAQPQNAV
jgi:hypothetical protein